MSYYRGMFFAHMGWLLVRKHPEVKRKGAQLDLSDLFNDPILAFQRRFFSDDYYRFYVYFAG